jgi:hypothetical protein
MIVSSVYDCLDTLLGINVVFRGESIPFTERALDISGFPSSTANATYASINYAATGSHLGAATNCTF